MRTKQIQVYKFKELPKETQEKLIQRERETLNEYLDLSWWGEDVKRAIEDEGFDEVELHYDLSYCQGSHFTFTAGLLLNTFLLRRPEIYLKYNYLIKLYDLSAIKEGIVYLDFEPNDDLPENHEAIVKELEDYIQSVVDELDKKYYKEGYEVIEDETSEERVREFLEDKEYDENGDENGRRV